MKTEIKEISPTVKQIEIEIEAEKIPLKRIVEPPADLKRELASAPTPNWWKYFAAAAIILLVGSTALNFYFFNQYRKYNTEYTNLLAAQTEMANNFKGLQAKAENYATAMAMLKDTNMAVVKMKGVDQHPNSAATVYWDKRSKDVYLVINNLPKPPPGKQYQLWAMVDGKPVDAGLLKWNEANPLAQMKNIPAVQAFAITLENEGGTTIPNMDAMYVIGKI